MTQTAFFQFSKVTDWYSRILADDKILSSRLYHLSEVRSKIVNIISARIEDIHQTYPFPNYTIVKLPWQQTRFFKSPLISIILCLPFSEQVLNNSRHVSKTAYHLSTTLSFILYCNNVTDSNAFEIRFVVV